MKNEIYMQQQNNIRDKYLRRDINYSGKTTFLLNSKANKI